MKTPTPAIRLTKSVEVERSLAYVSKYYPALTEAELLKLGLSKLVVSVSREVDDSYGEIARIAAASLNVDGYLDDPEEDIYSAGMGKKVDLG